jgi:hypothetical protein
MHAASTHGNLSGGTPSLAADVWPVAVRGWSSEKSHLCLFRIGFTEFTKGVSMQVSADSAWTVTIEPVSAAPTIGASGSGAGDGVYLFSGGAGTLTATYTGDSNFTVEEEAGGAFSDPLLINTIGTFSGTVPMTSGPAVLVIGADGGTWTTQTK